nr:hypothetical protein Ccrd_019299 [Ipomoea trifida]
MDGKRSRGRGGFLKGKLNWSLYRASATHKSVSYYHPTTDHTPIHDSYIYGGIAVDEEIDRKAANYISSVRERFSLA